MYCIPPNVITPAKLVSSTIAEPDTTLAIPEIEWVSGSVITQDQQVIKASLHKKYRAIRPLTSAENIKSPEQDTTAWQEIGATNKYAMFELNRSTRSISNDSITVLINPQERTGSIFLSGLIGSDVQIEILDANDVVQKVYNFGLSMRMTVSWSTYFFGKFLTKPSLAIFDLPLYYQGKIRVTISNSSTGGVGVSSIIVGNAVYMGEVQWEPESDAQNFSKIERSFDGNLQAGVNLIPRRSVDLLDLRIFAPKAITNILKNLRSELNGVPAVWTGLDQDSSDPYYEILLIFGLHRNFKINIKYPEYTLVTLKLEEM